MALEVRLRVRNFVLNDIEARRIQRHLRSLGRRLAGWPDPRATLTISWHQEQRRMEARLRIRLGHLGPHLISRRSAETADHAVRLTIEDVKRQVERGRAPWRVEVRRRHIWPPHAALSDAGQ
ncbi:MAG: hypothetical protein EPO21_05050 [Chloroflexota bacterium]|nr:MAG: hypothetical protein EPO21_05050 [Chloroflexota bacterium]